MSAMTRGMLSSVVSQERGLSLKEFRYTSSWDQGNGECQSDSSQVIVIGRKSLKSGAVRWLPGLPGISLGYRKRCVIIIIIEILTKTSRDSI